MSDQIRTRNEWKKRKMQTSKDDLLRRSLAMLKKNEWVFNEERHHITQYRCNICGRFENDGHASDCSLAVLIKDLDAVL